MRKALMGLIMAATVLTPIAAQAQDRDERRARAERSQRSEARGPANFERREARQEARQEAQVERREVRQEARSERREVRQEARVERREAGPVRVERRQEPVQVVQRSRRDSAYPQAWQGDPNDRMRRHYEELERRNQYRYGTREQRQDVRREVREEHRDWRRDRRDDRRDWRDERRDHRRDWRRDWSRDWRYDNRYDWNGWRYRNRNIFRVPRYYSPYRNYGYRRFGIGVHLDPIFFGQRYWVNDPFYYRLPPAPPGARWVRYYNDVLLVDTWSGEVIDVIYDFFW